MYWDYAFAIAYGIAFYSLLFLLTFDADWPAYTVPIHVIMDYFENTLTWIALTTFENNESVSGVVYLMPVVSTVKWSLAGLNMMMIPVLAIWRLGEWLLADD